MNKLLIGAVLFATVIAAVPSAEAQQAYIGNCTWGDDNGYGAVGKVWDAGCQASYETCVAFVGNVCDNTTTNAD